MKSPKAQFWAAKDQAYRDNVRSRRDKYVEDVNKNKADRSISPDELEQTLEKLKKDFIKDLKNMYSENFQSTEKSGFASLVNQYTTEISADLTTMGSQLSATFGTPLKALSPTLNKIERVLNTINAGLSAFNETMSTSIEQAVNDQMDMMGKINARLYGMADDSTNYYSQIADNLASTFLSGSFVDQARLLKQIANYVSQGVQFNVEERAYIQTIAEKTVTTFDAMESTLQQLTRINGVDLTVSQFGAESALTNFLNANYNGTEYLNSMYDTVLGKLYEGLTQMDYSEATEFNYTVQKWLAAMYEVGVGDALINSLAEGINYLATGNVSALEGNSSLQNLLVMGATKGGLSYSSMLTEGITSSEIDVLMQNIVEYLQDIAYNTDNEVVKSAWKEITGVTVSDFRAMANLTAQDIEQLASSTVTFEDAINEAQHQIEIFENPEDTNVRVSYAERVKNQVNNFMYSIGSELVNDAGLYEQYYKAQLVETFAESLSGSIPIIGDLAESVVEFITGTQQTGALVQAYNKAWIKSGGGQEATIQATAGTLTNTGAVVTVGEGGTVAAVSEEELADLVSDMTYKGSNFSDLGILTTDYADITDAYEAFKWAKDNGYQIFDVNSYTGDAGSDLLNSNQLNTSYAQQRLDQDQIDLTGNGYLGYYQEGRGWGFIKSDGTPMNYEDYLALSEGTTPGAHETTQELSYLGTADYDTVSSSQVTIDIFNMLSNLISTSWNPNAVGGGLYAFGNTQFATSRGSQYYGLDNATLSELGLTSEEASAALIAASEASGGATTVTTALSYSTNIGKTNSEAITTLASNEEAITQTQQVITSVQEDTTKTLEELYTALFLDSTMSVRVNLVAIDDGAKDVLMSAGGEALEQIRTKVVDGVVNVAMESNTDMFQATSYIRSM